jgi:hypothetical protein
MDGEDIRRKGRTWKKLTTYKLFEEERRVLDHRMRLPKVEFIYLTKVGCELVRGLGYEPVGPITRESRDDVIQWFNTCFRLLKAGLISDFKLEREMRTNDLRQFMIYQNDQHRNYPDVVLKIPSPSNDQWLAIKRQSVGGCTREYRAFADRLSACPQTNFLFLQKSWMLSNPPCERLLEIADWPKMGKNIAFGYEYNFHKDPCQMPVRFNSGSTNFYDLIAKIFQFDSLTVSSLDKTKLGDALLKQWVRTPQKAA